MIPLPELSRRRHAYSVGTGHVLRTQEDLDVADVLMYEFAGLVKLEYSVSELADYVLENWNVAISYEEAVEIVEKIFDNYGHEQSGWMVRH